MKEDPEYNRLARSLNDRFVWYSTLLVGVVVYKYGFWNGLIAGLSIAVLSTIICKLQLIIVSLVDCLVITLTSQYPVHVFTPQTKPSNEEVVKDFDSEGSIWKRK